MQLYGAMTQATGYGFSVQWEAYTLPAFGQYHERTIKAQGTASTYESAGKALADAMKQHATRKG